MKRIDDMLIINGVNVFPSQFEECIYKHLNSSTNWLIRVKEKEALKKLFIDIEIADEILNNKEKTDNLKQKLIKDIKAYVTITPHINFVPVSSIPLNIGKSKRVIIDS